MLQMIAKELPADNFGVKMANQRTEQCLSLVDERLGKSKFLVGSDFTAADIMIVFSLTTARLFVPMDLSSYPNILRYLKEIGERPAYQRAMEKGDPKLKPVLDAGPTTQNLRDLV